MARKVLIIFMALFITVNYVFVLQKITNAIAIAVPTPQFTPDPKMIEDGTNKLIANICSGHGGVSCSTINSNASIVCNDGTIDTSLSTIYAVPQCQKTLEDIATQQSDFMAESGCYPPSEMACIDEQSYQNLFEYFYALGLAKSELAKNELAQCRSDISAYNIDNKNYKQCLISRGRPNFELSGKIVLPMLKAAFCPLYYGGNSSYDAGADLCLCDAGYFLQNDQCIQADKICKDKYGSKASAKNGSCILPSTASVFLKPTPVPTPDRPAIPEVISVPYNQNIDYRSVRSDLPEATTSPIATEISDYPAEESANSFIQNIIGRVISGIKKMLDLF